MKRVLIVDDAQFMRFQLRKILEKNQFEVAGEAENGLIGLQKCKELEPDIVTMDITMPEMDGIEALKSLVTSGTAAKIIMISAMGQEPLIRQAILAGAKDFIVKPFKEDTVIEKLNKL